MRFAAFLIVWLFALAAIAASEHKATNEGLPLVKSGAAQTDTAKANMLLSPCPLTPQNLPHIMKEEQA